MQLQCGLTDITSITISVVGFLLAFYIYLRDKRDKVRRELAREVVAYYSIEEEAINLLNKETNDKYKDRKKAKTILRNAAMTNENNPARYRPKHTANSVKKYL